MPMAIRSSIMTIPCPPTAETAQPDKRMGKDFLANGSSQHLIWQRTSPNQHWCDFIACVDALLACVWVEASGMRGGCDFHQTRIGRPERAEPHWLILLVASWWMVSVGGQADAPQILCIRCCWSTQVWTWVPLVGREPRSGKDHGTPHRKERS